MDVGEDGVLLQGLKQEDGEGELQPPEGKDSGQVRPVSRCREVACCGGS